MAGNEFTFEFESRAKNIERKLRWAIDLIKPHYIKAELAIALADLAALRAMVEHQDGYVNGDPKDASQRR